MYHIDDCEHFSGAAEEAAPKILENLRKRFKKIFLFYFLKLSSIENTSPRLQLALSTTFRN